MEFWHCPDPQPWATYHCHLVCARTLDATPLRERFTCLTISVTYRGNAILVTWAILPATQKQAWNPHWVRLLALIHPAIPADWTVLVLTDRDL